MEFNFNAIPLISRNVVVRNDSNGMLLFQVKTDEIYFIPFSTYKSVLLNCDGSNTLKEIYDQLSLEIGINREEEYFENFISNLYERNIIELW